MLRGFLFLILLPLCVKAECVRTYRLPYDKVHENAQPGYDVLQAVLASMGCQTEKIYLDATIARHHRALAEGKLDILAEASKLPERERFAWFSQPYRTEAVVLMAKRDNKKINDTISLAAIEKNKYRVIADEHAWWGPEVKRLLPKWKSANLLVPNSQGGAEYRELQLGRADVLISTDASFNTVQQQFPSVYINNPNIYAEPVHFMFSRATVSEAEVNAFDLALATYLKEPKAQ